VALTDDLTDLSKYRSAASSAPAGGPTTAPATVPTRTSSGVDVQHLYHLSDSEMNLQVLFGSRYILDPGTDTETIKYQTEGPDNDILHGTPTRTKFAPEDSPWSLPDALQFFYNSTPESRAYIQAALYNQGLLPKKWNKFGQDDDQSAKAWRNALLRAAKGNQTVWQTLTGKKVTMTQFFDGSAEGGNQVKMAAGALSRNGGGGGGGGGGGAGRAPLQIRYTNPADLKAQARVTAQNTIGYVPDEQFLDNFVKLYHGMEAAPQKAAYSGKSFTEAPHVDVAAADQLRSKYHTEATGMSVAKTFGNMLNIMGVTQ
jgi:hypothetical protein